jgi:hypothetical protein
LPPIVALCKTPLQNVISMVPFDKTNHTVPAFYLRFAYPWIATMHNLLLPQREFIELRRTMAFFFLQNLVYTPARRVNQWANPQQPAIPQIKKGAHRVARPDGPPVVALRSSRAEERSRVLIPSINRSGSIGGSIPTAYCADAYEGETSCPGNVGWGSASC